MIIDDTGNKYFTVAERFIEVPVIKKVITKESHLDKMYITKDTIYNVINQSEYFYIIVCNTGEERAFSKSWFIDSETVESNKIKTLVAIPIKVIFNEPATIVFWNDGTKTVVKASKNDKFDKVKGYLIALHEKISGLSKSKLNKFYEGL